MNVLFLTAWYPVENTKHKGIFVQEHAHAIAKAGHNVRVVAIDISSGNSIWKKSETRSTESDGVQVHVISLHSKYWKKIYAVFPIVRRLLMKYVHGNFLRNFTPDIVHSNVLYPAGILGQEIADELNIPHILTEHWSKANTFLESHFYGSKGKVALRNVDAITFVSEFLLNRMHGYIPSSVTCGVVPNVIRTEIFSYVPKISTDKIVFAAVAAWQAPKRPELFVNALNKIAAENPLQVYELHLFGEGPQLDHLKTSVHSPNLRIIYRGFCRKEEIASQLQECNYFLHASDIETFSIVVAEALSTGTPVIASDRGALPELVNTVNGIVCENTSEAWIQGIKTALARTYDSRHISLAVREKYSAESIGNAFSRLYANINTRKKD